MRKRSVTQLLKLQERINDYFIRSRDAGHQIVDIYKKLKGIEAELSSLGVMW